MLLSNINKKITVYCDGPKIEEIDTKLPLEIDGYTFNPSLFRKNKAEDLSPKSSAFFLPVGLADIF